MMSIYPNQGYFIDFQLFSNTAKIFRAIHIDSTHSDTDMIGMVYSLIHDDIFNQQLEYMEAERLAVWSFTTQNEMFEIYYNAYNIKYKGEILSRSITPMGGKFKGKFFYTYGDALIYLYKHMSQSKEIRDDTIKRNGMDYESFVKYMERYKKTEPEKFI